MKKHFLKIRNSPLLLLFLVISCKGQVKTSLPEADKNVPLTIAEAHQKIVRTQGTQSGVVRCELLDKDGNIWFSISGEGIYRYDGAAFINFTTANGLCNNNVSAMLQDKSGNILIGTRSGICKYDGKRFSQYFEADTLNGLHITSLLEDKEGTIWFGTMSNGVYRYNGKTAANFLHNGDPKFNPGGKGQLILDILQDRKGNLWFSSWNGGGVWRYDGETFKNFLPSADYYKANEDKRNFTDAPSANITYTHSHDDITDDMIFSIAEDSAGNIWFATRDHGACLYDGKSFTSFWKKEGFLSRGAYSILEDKKGNLWLTTEEDGIWCYDGKSMKNLSEKDGLVNNAVMSILEDKNGDLWLGTKWFGLSRYDGERFTTFSEYANGTKQE